MRSGLGLISALSAFGGSGASGALIDTLTDGSRPVVLMEYFVPAGTNTMSPGRAFITPSSPIRQEI